MTRRFCLAFFFIFLIMPGICLGEGGNAEEDQVTTMPEVVVTATRTEQEVQKIPANVSIITSKDIENSSAKTVPDLLRYEEGITVSDTLGNGKFVNVDIRGYGETGSYNTLVLVDGRRVNDIDLRGVDWTQIPLEHIERIEVVRGTGSVLYGDNASGGVINIITKIPPEKIKATASFTYGSYDFTKGSASISGGKGGLKGSLFATFQDTDGYRENNHYRAGDVDGKIVYDISDFVGLSLSGSYHNDNYGLPGPLSTAQMESDRRQKQDLYYDEGESTDQYLKLGVDFDLMDYGAIVMDLSYRISDSELQDNSAWGAFVQKNDKKTWAFTPRYLWDGNIFNHKNTFIAGVDLYSSDYDVKNYSGPPLAQTGIANSDRSTIGVYFNDEFYLFDRLIFSLGARHENVKYELNQDDIYSGSLEETVREDENAYNIGLAYLYYENSSLFMRINRSFRFPLADEMVETVEVAPWTYQLQLNSDLKPQTGMHYEVGAKHRFSKHVATNLIFYRVDTKDEILLNKITFPPFGQNVNYPETLRLGIEFGCKINPVKNVAIFGNYTYESATFEQGPFDGNDIPAVPKNKGNLGLSIDDILPGLIFVADYSYVGSSYAISDMANQYPKLDAYYTIDLKLSYTYKLLKAFAGIKNLTDQKYSETAIIGSTTPGVYYYPAPERNYFAGIELKF
ncbi:TonB-dependent receptor [Thermodesulfobacteriota bacterium]